VVIVKISYAVFYSHLFDLELAIDEESHHTSAIALPA